MASFIDAETCHLIKGLCRKSRPFYTENLPNPLSLIMESRALEIAEHLIRLVQSTLSWLISVAALVPKAELEGWYGGITRCGLQGHDLMLQALRKLTGAIRQDRLLCYSFNQTQRRRLEKVMFWKPWGLRLLVTHWNSIASGKIWDFRRTRVQIKESADNILG